MKRRSRKRRHVKRLPGQTTLSQLFKMQSPRTKLRPVAAAAAPATSPPTKRQRAPPPSQPPQPPPPPPRQQPLSLTFAGRVDFGSQEPHSQQEREVRWLGDDDVDEDEEEEEEEMGKDDGNGPMLPLFASVILEEEEKDEAKADDDDDDVEEEEVEEEEEDEEEEDGDWARVETKPRLARFLSQLTRSQSTPSSGSPAPALGQRSRSAVPEGEESKNKKKKKKKSGQQERRSRSALPTAPPQVPPPEEPQAPQAPQPPPPPPPIRRRNFRPLPQAVDAATCAVDVQVTDVDHVVRGNSLLVRIWGCTARGNSTLVYAHKFRPFFYVAKPAGWDQLHMLGLFDYLRQGVRRLGRPHDHVLAWALEKKKSFFGYERAPRDFIKFYVSAPGTVKLAARVLAAHKQQEFQLFETVVDCPTRFGVEYGVLGASWIRLPAGKYRARSFDEHESSVQAEFDIDAADIAPGSAALSETVAPLLIASVDIECISASDGFPVADNVGDAVIMIATSIMKQGQTKPLYRHIVTWKECAPVENVEVEVVGDERELLTAWRHFMRQVDPDVVTGYNIMNFDLPYVLRRAHVLSVPDFAFLGRHPTEQTYVQDVTTSTRAMGTQQNTRIRGFCGRMLIDLFKVIVGEHALSSYKLGAVSAHFLGTTKEDVPYASILPLFMGGPASVAKVASYCVKDTVLPLSLMCHLETMINLIEMSRVTGVTPNALVTRGQQYKVFAQILAAAGRCGYVVPTVERPERHEVDASTKKEYQGATVIDAKKGMYTTPVATLDFASLYPSIMMAHNLSYETLVWPRVAPASFRGVPKEHILRALALTDADVEKFNVGTPSEAWFLKRREPDEKKQEEEEADESRGLLPQALENLLAARKRAKKAMKEAEDETLKKVLNGRQLALKISCNSIYGFSGATTGYLPCLAIAATVTSVGRALIDKTKMIVENTYTAANGYEGDATVVYGDTDSVMVNFHVPEAAAGPSAVQRAMDLGEEAARIVTRVFPKPILLEFEKVYLPYMLFSKKRYAGMLYSSSAEKPDYMDVKGLQTIRRDSCLLLRENFSRCLEMLLHTKPDVEGAVFEVQAMLSQLRMRAVPLHKLVLSRRLSRLVYSTKAPHAELAKKMEARDPTYKARVGDRIPFVVVEGKGTSVADRAEDPLVVLQKGVPVDVDWYVEHQLRRPLEEMFSLVMPNPSSVLFEGDHMRALKQQQPKERHGVMGNFVEVLHRCQACKCALSQGKRGLCVACTDMDIREDLKRERSHNLR